MHIKLSQIRPHRKRSLFRLTSLIILGAGGRSFFLRYFICKEWQRQTYTTRNIYDKRDVSTPLTRRRYPRQSTLFSSNIRLPTLQPSSRDWRADIDRTHSESSTYLEVKTQFWIHTATQACTWTTLRLPLYMHVLYVHACIQKVFCGGVKKFAVALQNAVGRVSRNRNLFRCGLMKIFFTKTFMQVSLTQKFPKLQYRKQGNFQ